MCLKHSEWTCNWNAPLKQPWLALRSTVCTSYEIIKSSLWDVSPNISVRTKLTQVQAEIGSLHQAGVLTHGPNVEVHEDRQAGEGRHSEPHQEEQVGQEHQLQTQTDEPGDVLGFNDEVYVSKWW